jgi:hypothetical protein
MSPASRTWARALFLGVIALEWLWILTGVAEERRVRLVGVMVLVGTIAGVSELLLRRTALDDDARDVIAFFWFGAILGLLPALIGP